MTGVYAAITATMADLAKAGIGKGQRNEDDGYSFRGIDDIYNALAPLLSKHRLCVMPRMLERQVSERRGASAETMVCVTVRAAFDFVSAVDGSCHTVEMFGEAIDASDKATNKAMSAAYKYAALQTFCIPTQGDNDADRRSPRIAAPLADPTPVQGWAQWVIDIGDVIGVCETDEALNRLQTMHRVTLRALQLAEQALYHQLGEQIQARRSVLASAKLPPTPEASPTAGPIAVAPVAPDTPQVTTPAPRPILSLRKAAHATAAAA